MGLSQREKGKRGERAAVKLLRSLGYEAERTVQHCGRSPDSADIRHSIPGVRLEIKVGYNAVELWHDGEQSPQTWMERLKDECQPGETPVILWRKDRAQWVAIMEVGAEVVGGMAVATANIGQALKLATLIAQ